MGIQQRASRIFEAIGYFPAGFGFVLIDIRYRGIDIFPDLVGYLCFAAGLSRLPIRSRCLKAARALAFALILLSIPGTIFFDSPWRIRTDIDRWFPPIRLWDVRQAAAIGTLAAVGEVAGLAMAWCLLGGLLAEARRQGRPVLAADGAARRREVAGGYAIAIAYLAYWYATHWSRSAEPRLLAAAVPAFVIVLSIVIAWRIVRWVRQAARELSVEGWGDEDISAPD